MPNSIWITGDTHGDVTRLNTSIFPEQKSMDKSDVVIILGDFGLLWNYKGEDKYEKFWLDWLSGKPFTTCFIDGNHECFPRLFNLPEEEHFGAPVGVVRESVFYLKRGYVYSISGKKIFTFGGARSHDITDGILQADDPSLAKKKQLLAKEGKRLFRVDGVSWWKDEIEQDPAVYQRAVANLEKNSNKVDFIMTHCCASGTETIMGYLTHDQLTGFLETIHDTVEFDDWFFGHYHENTTVLPHEYCLYEQIVQIA